MPRTGELRTERLVMRRWRDDDLEPFAALNADPVVMEYYHNGPFTRDASAEWIARMAPEFDRSGFGLWAVEVPGVAPFIGYVGLHEIASPLPFTSAPFTPAIEVGWRLAAAHWGRGYATEAARAAVAFGFAAPGIDEIVSFTAVTNVRSQRVMQRIGMTRDVDGDFEHPAVPVGHPLRPHVLYRIGR